MAYSEGDTQGRFVNGFLETDGSLAGLLDIMWPSVERVNGDKAYGKDTVPTSWTRWGAREKMGRLSSKGLVRANRFQG